MPEILHRYPTQFHRWEWWAQFYFGITNILTKLASFLAYEIDVPGVIRAFGKNSKSEQAIPWENLTPSPPQSIHFHLRIWREQEGSSHTGFLIGLPQFWDCTFLPPQCRLLTLQRMFLLSTSSEAEQCGTVLGFSICADEQRKEARSPRPLSPWQKGGKSPFVGQGTTRENKAAIVPGISRRPPTN